MQSYSRDVKALSVLGVDIGASNFRVYVERGKDSYARKTKADFSNPPISILRKINSMVGGAKKFDAIGIAVAGFVSSKEGSILKMPNAGVSNIRISDVLQEAFRPSKSVKVMNDAVAAVYGEWISTSEKDKDMVYLTFSTGIGGAAILDGKLVAGKEGNSHEVGHIVIDAEGRVVCGCGGRGHWEAYCSGSGLVSFFRYYANKEEELSAETIFSLATSGKMQYKRFLKKAITMNSAGLASVINVYSPELLVIGGSVALHNWENYILPSIEEAKSKVILAMPHVKKSELGDYASAYGAAKLAMSSTS